MIGGGSAGATIQGSYLVRGDTRGPLLPMGDHERGFGFLANSAIDQHVLVRNRQFDLVTIVRAHPELLGLGLDADVGIVVHGGEPLWLPHIQPRLTLTPEIGVTAGRVHAAPCTEGERELIPIARDLFFDSTDGAKITIQRNESGAAAGLTWGFHESWASKGVVRKVQATKVH